MDATARPTERHEPNMDLPGRRDKDERTFTPPEMPHDGTRARL